MTVKQRVALSVPANADNSKYLETKRVKLGHIYSEEPWQQL